MAYPGQLGRVGIWSAAWSAAFRTGDTGLIGAGMDAAAEPGELGFGMLRIGQSASARHARPVLNAARQVTVATGIMPLPRQITSPRTQVCLGKQLIEFADASK